MASRHLKVKLVGGGGRKAAETEPMQIQAN